MAPPPPSPPRLSGSELIGFVIDTLRTLPAPVLLVLVPICFCYAVQLFYGLLAFGIRLLMWILSS